MDPLHSPSGRCIWGQLGFDDQNYTDPCLKARHRKYEVRKEGFSCGNSPTVISYPFFHATVGYHEQKKDDI